MAGRSGRGWRGSGGLVFGGSRRGLPPSDFVIRVATVTLAVVILVVTIPLVIGLFHPDVNNADVFKIIGPAFQSACGAFILLLGKALSHPVGQQLGL